MKRSALATWAALLAYSIFGFSFLFSKVALNLADPFVLLSARFVTAFLVLNLLALTGKMPFHLKDKPIAPLLLLGLVQPVIYFICENYGIAMTSASFSGVMLGIIPVVGLVTGRLILKERCSRFQILCAVLSVAGVALTTVGGEVAVSVLGTVLLLTAAASSSVFSAVSRGISDRFSPFERTYVMFALGSVVFTGIAVVQNWSDPAAVLVPLSMPRFWLSVAYLAVASSVGAFLLLNFAMNHISVAKASIFSNFTTVISVLAGILILHDSFSPLQLAGIVVITLSVCGVSYRKDAPAKE